MGGVIFRCSITLQVKINMLLNFLLFMYTTSSEEWSFVASALWYSLMCQWPTRRLPRIRMDLSRSASARAKQNIYRWLNAIKNEWFWKLKSHSTGTGFAPTLDCSARGDPIDPRRSCPYGAVPHTVSCTALMFVQNWYQPLNYCR